MKLYLLRHGIAEDPAAGTPDAARALTDQGREKLATILTRASEAGVRPDVMLTSPLLRAKQTAEMAVQELGFAGPLIETTNLIPSAPAWDLWDEIRGYKQSDAVMAVGHNPHLTEFANVMMGAAGHGLEMKRGALACFEVLSFGPEPRGTLAWLLTAKLAGA